MQWHSEAGQSNQTAPDIDKDCKQQHSWFNMSVTRKDYDLTAQCQVLNSQTHLKQLKMLNCFTDVSIETIIFNMEQDTVPLWRLRKFASQCSAISITTK